MGLVAEASVDPGECDGYTNESSHSKHARKQP